jgi:hypothetical protein
MICLKLIIIFKIRVLGGIWLHLRLKHDPPLHVTTSDSTMIHEIIILLNQIKTSNTRLWKQF